MGAEALAVVGLVSNVLQFVDFVSGLFNETREIYRSIEGQSEAHIELEMTLKDLTNLTKELETGTACTGEPTTGSDSLALLAAKCKEIAGDLEKVMGTMKVKYASKHKRKWHSFQKALEGIWRKGDIESMLSRISDIRRQLSFHLQLDIKKQLDSVKEGYDALREDERRTTETLARIQQSISAQEQRTAKMMHDCDTSKLFEDISLLVDKENERRQRVLRSLCFQSMHERHANIANAHRETFQWVFRTQELLPGDPRSNTAFDEWLRSPHGIYWISGKPGSGKSTLMKYLCDDKNTISLLKEWAAGDTLFTAKFFFWHGGTKMQKSVQGLLQSLLFEILRQKPHWIKTICPSRWSSDTANLDPWDTREISRILQRLARQDFGANKFCFFIDGLDEHDGDLENVIECLKSLDRAPNIKLCISSRPWNCFEDAFGNSSWMLRLEDLTKQDIEEYVRDNLYLELQTLRTQDGPAFAEEISTEILRKAQGVFLWVFLAVRSLRQGITDRDTATVLRNRLRAFPPELNDFFKLILGSVEGIHWHETAFLLSAALKAPEPLTTLAYSFIMEEDQDIATTLANECPLPDEEITSRRELLRWRLNARCKGLLQVYDSTTLFDGGTAPHRHMVDFLHRTVREFLLGRDVEVFKYLPSDHRMDVTICKALLAELKTTPYGQEKLQLPNLESIWTLISNAEQEHGTSDVTIIDQLDYHIVQLHNPYLLPHLEHGIPSKPLLENVVQRGVLSYMEHKAAAGAIDFSQSEGSWLLECAARFSGSAQPEGSEKQLEIVRLIFKNGVSPNSHHGSESPWTEIVSTPMGAGEDQIQLTRLFLSFGADIHQRDASGSLLWFREINDNLSHEKHASEILGRVEAFLSHGADPNDVYCPHQETSVWDVLLRTLSSVDRVSTHHYRLVQLFIQYGADPHVSMDTSCRPMPVSQVFRRVFPYRQANNLCQLLLREIEYRKTRGGTCASDSPTPRRKRKVNDDETSSPKHDSAEQRRGNSYHRTGHVTKRQAVTPSPLSRTTSQPSTPAIVAAVAAARSRSSSSSARAGGGGAGRKGYRSRRSRAN
ncbi:hypothetical protein SLS58_011063 [Diplodia intermedia]|uniref:NACHT domain-containing protein n=1 Tax=Diplodia intermedia TaxID=856260 RepID=A0ABR3T1U8_9PEZI